LYYKEIVTNINNTVLPSVSRRQNSPKEPTMFSILRVWGPPWPTHPHAAGHADASTTPLIGHTVKLCQHHRL